MTRIEMANRRYMSDLLYLYHEEWLKTHISPLPWVQSNLTSIKAFSVSDRIGYHWREVARVWDPEKYPHVMAMEILRLHTIYLSHPDGHDPDSEVGEIFRKMKLGERRIKGWSGLIMKELNNWVDPMTIRPNPII